MDTGLQFRPGILHDMPDDLYSSLKEMEDIFTVDRLFLKKITSHFVGELERGLSNEGGDIPMCVTWVMGHPSGNEKGHFLTLDMGGTHLRVCDIHISDNRKIDMNQWKCKIPPKIKSATAEELWDFVAGCVQTFLQEHNHASGTLPLAFTFSYPVTQLGIKSGILQRWTKDFNVSGVEGYDIVPQLEDALKRKNLPVRVAALINDTTGILVATSYRNPKVRMGSIFSTGCNAAYMEKCCNIPKIADRNLPPEAQVAINTEYGAFDNQGQILPRTRFDKQNDMKSARPGQQLYEKMVAGLYMGELLRLILIELHQTKGMFMYQGCARLNVPHAIDTNFMSAVESDETETLTQVHKLIRDKLGLEAAPHERRACRFLVELVGTRAARLYACGIAAVCKKGKIPECHVGVDGSVFNNYSHFRKRAKQALRDIFDWPEDRDDLVEFHSTEDGSGIGAALIAAIALERSDGELLK